MQRLRRREAARYGDLIGGAGDMAGASADFLRWAEAYDVAGPEQRSLIGHETWLAAQTAPVLRLDSSARFDDLVRAVTHPYPGAFTWLGDRRLFVWWARPAPAISGLAPGEMRVNDERGLLVGTGEGALRLERVAVEGEAECSAIEWIRGGGRLSGEFLGKARQ